MAEWPTQETAPARSEATARARLLLAVRVVASLGLLAFVIRDAELADIGAAFARCADAWTWLVPALLLPAVGLLLAALRWRVLLDAQAIRVPLTGLLSALLVANFFNQIFPSTIGGDVVRSRRIARAGGGAPYLVSLAIVVADRLVGILGMLVVALAAALASPTLVRDLPAVPAVVAAMGAAIVALAVLALSPLGRAVAGRVLSVALLARVRDRLRRAYDALLAYRHQRARLLLAVLLSVGLQITIIGQFLVLAKALRIDMPLLGLAIIVPIVTAITLIPITINGIGLRENALAVLGAPLGMTAASAVALSWLFLGAALCYGVAGGLFLAFEPRAQRQSNHQET